jgi:hypothetical protein
MVQMKMGRNNTTFYRTERPVSGGPHIALEQMQHHKKLCILPMTTCGSWCQVQKAQGSKLKRTLDRRARMQMHHAPILMPTPVLTTVYRHNDGAILWVLNRNRTSSFTKVQHRQVMKLQSYPGAGASPWHHHATAWPSMKKQNTTWRAQQVRSVRWTRRADLTIAYLQWQDGQLDPCRWWLPLVYCYCRQEHHESFCAVKPDA